MSTSSPPAKSPATPPAKSPATPPSKSPASALMSSALMSSALPSMPSRAKGGASPWLKGFLVVMIVLFIGLAGFVVYVRTSDKDMWDVGGPSEAFVAAAPPLAGLIAGFATQSAVSLLIVALVTKKLVDKYRDGDKGKPAPPPGTPPPPPPADPAPLSEADKAELEAKNKSMKDQLAEDEKTREPGDNVLQTTITNPGLDPENLSAGTDNAEDLANAAGDEAEVTEALNDFDSILGDASKDLEGAAV